MPKMVFGHGLGHIQPHLNVGMSLYPKQHRVFLLVHYILGILVFVFLNIKNNSFLKRKCDIVDPKMCFKSTHARIGAFSNCRRKRYCESGVTFSS